MKSPQTARRSVVYRLLLPVSLLLAVVILGVRYAQRRPQIQVKERAKHSVPAGTITNSLGMQFVPIPAGEFTMGAGYEDAEAEEKPAHRVRISKPFYMSLTEITRKEYEAVTGLSPSQRAKQSTQSASRLPVDSVSWEAATAFCRQLSDLPAEKAAGRTYRLPTESEWEYACRAGTTTRFSTGDKLTTNEANFSADSVGGPQEAGFYPPNGWGLHEMHGNVHEWCADWYSESYYSDSPLDDPQGPSSGRHKVTRGGCWWGTGWTDWHTCSARHHHFPPTLMDELIGFRMVCEVRP